MNSCTPAGLGIQYDRLRQQIDGLRDGVSLLSGELASAWTRIAELEERLHDHEQATPHPVVTA